MKRGRRSFIRHAGSVVLGAPLVPLAAKVPGRSFRDHKPTGKAGRLELSYYPYDLRQKHTFAVSGHSRDTTPVVLTELRYEGITGYGEASLPPYLGETQASVTEFLSRLDLDGFRDPFLVDEILGYVDSLGEGNRAAKASVDIALHDLLGKLMDQPLYRIWGLNPAHTPLTSFTIGMDTPDVVRQKTREAARFRVLKVKLGGEDDRGMINAVRSVTDVPLYVDVNQGWRDKHQALDLIHWLAGQGVEFVEQPLPKEAIEDTAWLTERSPLPLIADEAFQRLPDVAAFHGVYSGINVKLMKSTGLREAKKMITVARALGMKVLMGCMIETSCAVSAAAQLSPLVDWADLDGNLLITNDLYDGVRVIEGKVTLNDRPGIGIIKREA